MIIKHKENHFAQNFDVYNFSGFSRKNRFDKESPSKNISDSQLNVSTSPKCRLCPSSSFRIFNPDPYVLGPKKHDFTNTFKETDKSTTISKLKQKFKGTPERNVSDEIESHTEIKRTFLDKSINEAVPVNCSEAEQAFHEDVSTELKEVCVKENGTKYSIHGAFQFMHQVWANCHLCNDSISYSSKNGTFNRRNKYFKEIYIKKEEAEASDEEIYATANTCVRCNKREIEYPTTNSPHNFLKLHSIRLHKSPSNSSSIDSSSKPQCNYPRFYSNFDKCQLQFQRASVELSDYRGDSRIHGMPTTGFSDRELIDFNSCEETHSTCSSTDDRTSVIYQQKKWSVEEGSNRNYIRALTHRNAETRTNNIQQHCMPLWTLHYDNVNYIRSFMSPLVGNAFLVL